MCGLIGHIASGTHDPCIAAAMGAIKHRGPDAQRIWSETLQNGQRLTLGHARLSIVDLQEASNQPFDSICGRYKIVFNGEIYNYKWLRNQLKQKGRRFRTLSDTEVLLAAFIEWGPACLPMLDGMFAFCIYDSLKQQLHFARDQIGIKPLYYFIAPEKRQLSFASEIAALSHLLTTPLEIDEQLFSMFLMNGWLYEPHTGFKNVRKLAPGQYMSFDISTGEQRLQTYYSPLQQTKQAPLSEILQESVGLQAVADVPVGIFFSGGLDSSVIAAAYPHGLTGLFMDYSDDRADIGLDQLYAQKIAARLGFPLTSHKHMRAKQNGDAIVEEFRAVAGGTEEPISDFTFSSSRQLSRLAKQAGFTVMLSGMGGDEIFAGYPRFHLAQHYAFTRVLRPCAQLIGLLAKRRSGFAKKANRLTNFLSSDNFVEAYTQLIGYFSTDETAQLLGRNDKDTWLHQITTLLQPAQHLSSLKKAMFLDFHGFLSHNLTVTDRASMAESLEVRVPLLTPNLTNWAFQQNDNDLIGYKQTKKPLRHFAVERIGRDLVDRPKQGFNPPLDSKIEILGERRILEEMQNGPLYDHIDMPFARKIVRQHFEKQSNETYKIWQLLYFSYWLEQQMTSSRLNAMDQEMDIVVSR